MRKERIVNLDGTEDPRCKQNEVKPIDTKTCRHNCRYWNYIKNKCLLGYGSVSAHQYVAEKSGIREKDNKEGLINIG